MEKKNDVARERSFRSQCSRYFIVWWYSTFCVSAFLIFVAALASTSADDIKSVGGLGALLVLYMSITAIIESIRSKKDDDNRNRYKVWLIAATGLAAAYLGFASALDVAPASLAPAGMFLVITALLGFIGLVITVIIWMKQTGK